MAFSLRVDEPVRIEDFQYEGDRVFMCRVGTDLAAHKLYFAAVGLDPFPEGAPEYWFGILERNAYTGEADLVLSGLRFARIISKADKMAILQVICGLTDLLLQECKPKKVTRVTHDAYQGGKGIEKHEVISKVFLDCGYRVTRCDSWGGQRAWLCELDEQNPIAADRAH